MIGVVSYTGQVVELCLQTELVSAIKALMCRRCPDKKARLTAVIIEGFHVTSYQANFASHLTRDRHVGFLSPQSSIGKYNKMSQNFLFSSYHCTNYNRVTRLLAHTLI